MRTLAANSGRPIRSVAVREASVNSPGLSTSTSSSREYGSRMARSSANVSANAMAFSLGAAMRQIVASIAESDHRIDPRGAPRRQGARDQRDGGEHRGHGHDDERVGRGHAEQLMLQAPAQGEREGGADSESAADQHETLPKHEVDDGAGA